MSRFLLNVFFIIIIGLSLTVVPVNIDLLKFENINFDFSKPPIEENTQEEASAVASFSSSIEEGTYLYNPEVLDITLKSTDDIGFYPDELKANLTLDILKNGELVKSFNSSMLDFGLALSSDDTVSTLTASIPLDKELLSMSTGHYTINIVNKSETANGFKNLSYDVTYIDDKKYIPATDDSMGKTIATIYYPDSELLRVVPVSREVSSRKNSMIRSILNALLEGAGPSSGLKVEAAAPFVPDARLGDGVVTLKMLSSDVEPFGISSAVATSAVDSLVYSLTAQPNVNEVKMLVNGSDKGLYFHDMSLTDTFKAPSEAKAYLGYQSTSEFNYLVPIAFGNDTDINIQPMFDALKTGSVEYASNIGLIQTVPQNVALNKFEIKDGVLSLDVSKEFLDAYNSNEYYSMLMIDSLVYSFTSFSTVDSVSITVDGSNITDFFGINISEPMKPKAYINPNYVDATE